MSRAGRSNSQAARWMTDAGYPITPATISRLRSGSIRPSIATIEGLAAYLSVPAADLIRTEPTTPDPLSSAVTALVDAARDLDDQAVTDLTQALAAVITAGRRR